jgi:RNA polymerase sigma factor (sigma-70 family)
VLKIVGADPDDAALRVAASRCDELHDLALRAAAGDRNAVHDLLVAVGPAMMRAVRRVLGRRTRDLEDVVQDAMEGLLSALPAFRGEATVLHFAYRVAVLSALVHRRRMAVREQWNADDPDAADNHPGTLGPAAAEDGVARARRKRTLGRLLDDLPTAQAEVLVLHFVLGFTIEEVAAAVGCPPETVRSRLRVAKESLRQRIGASRELADILETR